MLSYDQTKSLIIIPPTFEFSWNDFSQNKSHVQVVSWVGSLVVAPIHCRKQVPEDFLYILSSTSLHGRHNPSILWTIITVTILNLGSSGSLYPLLSTWNGWRSMLYAWDTCYISDLRKVPKFGNLGNLGHLLQIRFEDFCWQFGKFLPLPGWRVEVAQMSFVIQAYQLCSLCPLEWMWLRPELVNRTHKVNFVHKCTCANVQQKVFYWMPKLHPL